MRKEKGITLISLVITIIVLIILAGVSINLTIGENGIFNKAKYSKELYLNSQESENEKINSLSNELYSFANTDEKLGDLKINVSAEENMITNFAGKTISIENINDETEKYTYSLKDGETSYTINKLKYGNKYKITIEEIEDENYIFTKPEEEIKIGKEETIVELQYKHKGTYVFNNGNQCNSLTGGWKVMPNTYTSDNNTYNWSEWADGVSVNYRISNTIYCNIKNNGNNKGGIVVIMTNNKINLDNYSSYNVKYSSNYNCEQLPNVTRLWYSTTSTSTEYSKYRDNGFELSEYLEKENNELIFDISELKYRNVHVGFDYMMWHRGANAQMEINVEQVWLEK